MRTVEIGCVVEPVKKWNPKREGDGAFTYVDISSIDQHAKTVSELSSVDAIDAPSRARQLIASGDVLVSTVRPNLNAVAYVKPELDGATASTGYCVLRPRPSDLDGRYLFHWVRTVPFIEYLVQRATGASYPAVSDKIVRAAPIPLPPIEEQRRIAAVLDAAEALRAKRRQALAKLDSLTRSIFFDMFGDPKLKSKQLGFVPLGDLLKLKSGQGLSAKAMRPGLHLVYGGNGVSGTHSEYMFEESKVVIGRVGVYCGCVHVSKPRSWITDNALYVSWMSPHLSTTFLAAALELVNLNRFASQAAQPLISGGRIYPVAIPVPPLDAQQVFEQKVRAIADHRSRLEEGSAKLNDLFASLQQRAFRGEL